MTGLKDKLLNILLFPPRFFAGLNDKRASLCLGILLIGVIDLFGSDPETTYRILFTGMPAGSVRLNVLIAVGAVILLGAVDVIFFSVPMYDLFKYIKKREDKPHTASPVKVMKIYISSHFLIIPASLLMHFLFFRSITENSNSFIMNIYFVYFFAILIWGSGIISRGINTLFDFNPIFRRFSFIILFIWQFVWGMVFDLQIMNWLLRLFIQP